ncbi:MAG: phosphoribosylformylglycinamidine synthase subunit PurQ [Acidimicrobiales bacterium]|nr:phosphoribosylformylglycinamidine synthase subunit PurQ [Acidimicrobiales bacterium]
MATDVGVVVFPGTNCEFDVLEAIDASGANGHLLWHGNSFVPKYDSVILAGGFAHGDYLRPGAIARFSKIMEGISKFGADGGKIVGICNGFQVLTEAGLLPGALQKNRGLTFICEKVTLEVVSDKSCFTKVVSPGTVVTLPINHFSGNYTNENVDELEANGQVILKYCDNPNGSVNSIAGIRNDRGNIVGLMPHPERAISEITGGSDGLLFWKSLLKS